MKQRDLVKRMTDQDLRKSLLYTQLLLLVCTGICLMFSFPSLQYFISLFQWDIFEILLFGGGIAGVILLLDVLLMKFVPEKWIDDGGINERLFKGMKSWELLLYPFLIAVSEEFLFRGVIQSQFGLIVSSVLFAIVHIRYLDKIVLFTSVVFISFLIGYIFYYTNNLYVTIFAHFIVDFVLGITIRYSKS